MVGRLSSWILAALAVASLIYFVPAQVAADMIASTPLAAPAPESSAVQAPSADSVVADTLRSQGLDENEITARLAEMSAEDLSVLADSPEQVQVAGTDWGLIAIIGGLALLFALILYLLD